jgi:hypothetical protein
MSIMRVRRRTFIAALGGAAMWEGLRWLTNDCDRKGLTFPALAFVGNELGEHLLHAAGRSGIARKSKLRCNHCFL